jgi:hypothetical protein
MEEIKRIIKLLKIVLLDSNEEIRKIGLDLIDFII